MSTKQKIPLDRKPPKAQQPMPAKATDRPDGKRGLEDPELHRQGGDRLRDQGTHKRR